MKRAGLLVLLPIFAFLAVLFLLARKAHAAVIRPSSAPLPDLPPQNTASKVVPPSPPSPLVALGQTAASNVIAGGVKAAVGAVGSAVASALGLGGTAAAETAAAAVAPAAAAAAAEAGAAAGAGSAAVGAAGIAIVDSVASVALPVGVAAIFGYNLGAAFGLWGDTAAERLAKANAYADTSLVEAGLSGAKITETLTTATRTATAPPLPPTSIVAPPSPVVPPALRPPAGARIVTRA